MRDPWGLATWEKPAGFLNPDACMGVIHPADSSLGV